MTTWTALRLLKFVGVALFAAGTYGAVAHRSPTDRLRAAWTIAVPGFVLTWFAGYLLLKSTGRGMGDPFVSGSMLASLLALHGAVSSAESGPRLPARLLAYGGALASVGFMVAKDAGPGALFGAGVAAALVGVAASFAVPSATAPVGAPNATSATWAAFRWVARLEGATLILLMGITVPLRVATGIELDGGLGWIGWLHGVLVFIYLRALWSGATVLGWSPARVALGFVASLLPFGTFVFEWSVGRDPALAR